MKEADWQFPVEQSYLVYFREPVQEETVKASSAIASECIVSKVLDAL